MTPEQQRIKIAEACGCELTQDGNGFWVFSKPNQHPKRVAKHHDKDRAWALCCPDYLNDLNAMHEAERVLNPSLAAGYARMLTSIAWESEQPVFAPMTATAAQRAEAFLRTIGKWEEEL
jgi:hypothetical protein